MRRHVPAAGQDAQAGVRIRVPVRRRQRLQHLRRVGLARPRAGLPALARLADRLRVLRLEEAGPRQRGDQEAGPRLLLVVRPGQQGPQVQPGQDLQVSRSATPALINCFLFIHSRFCYTPDIPVRRL